MLIGATLTGKTTYAKQKIWEMTEKPPLVITCMESFQMFDPEIHGGIILDDFNLNDNLSCEMQLHLCGPQNSCVLDVKYGSKFIPDKIPRIICCNRSTFATGPMGGIVQQLRRRLFMVADIVTKWYIPKPVMRTNEDGEEVEQSPPPQTPAFLQDYSNIIPTDPVVPSDDA